MGQSSKTIADYQLVSRSDIFNIYRCPDSGVIYEVYQVVLNEGTNHDQELLLWNKRKNVGPNLVKVENLLLGDKAKCSSSRIVYVFTEAHGRRLSQVKGISAEQGRAYAKDVLIGCRQIFDNFVPYFTLTADKVAISQQGQAKVWVDENFGVNREQDMMEQYFAADSKKEDSIVLTTFSLVAKCVMPGKENTSFMNSIKGLSRPLTFANGIEAMEETRVDVTKSDVRSLKSANLFSANTTLAKGLKGYVDEILPYGYKLAPKRNFKRINILE